MLNIFSPRARSRFLDLELKRSRFLNVSVISSFLFFLFFHPPFHPLSTTASNDYHVVRIFARETVLLKTVQLTYFLPSFRMTDWNQTFLPEILAEKIVATVTFTGDEDRWHAKDFRVEILPPIVFHLSRGNKEVLEEEHLFSFDFRDNDKHTIGWDKGERTFGFSVSTPWPWTGTELHNLLPTTSPKVFS